MTALSELVMNEIEARECVEKIKAHITNARILVKELYDGRGWVALGYKTWRECVVAEFEKHQSYLYRELAASCVEENISPMGEIGWMPERQARPLTRLEPEVQREVWKSVVEETPPEQITAKVVEAKAKSAEPLNEAVKAIKEELKPQLPSPAQQTIIPDPPKPKDPIVAAVTEKVKSGEMTVVEAAKAIKVATSTGEFHVSQGNNDWYTPAEYLEAARKVMNGIDLDPASSDLAQKVVQAKEYYTVERCGLNQPWNGKVWLNPPFSMPLIEQFTDKLLAEWRAGNIDQAIVITNNATDTGWFHSLLSESKLACLTKGRVKFYSPANEGMAPRQGQAFFYLGDQPEQFVKTFSSFGLVIHL